MKRFLLILFALVCATCEYCPAQQAVTSLTLINADNDLSIPAFQSLTGVTVLNLATLPARNLNVRANASPSVVGSVVFGYDFTARYRIQNLAPYAFADDDNHGNYYAWTPSLGPHTITATPYTLGGGTGIAGTKLTWSFTVIDQVSVNVVTIDHDTSITIGGTRYDFKARMDTVYGRVGIRLDTTGWSNFKSITITDSSLIGK